MSCIYRLFGYSVAVLLFFLASAGFAATANKPLVVASVEPLSMLARDFYGDSVEVKTLLSPSQNPHHAAFSPQQLALLQRADIVIWLGADAEPYLRSFLSGKAQQVAALEQPAVAAQIGIDTATETKHPAHLDPHFWTDPAIMASLLPSLEKAGVTLLGLAPQTLHQRLIASQKQLTELWHQGREILAPVATTSWLSYHNPWEYFVDRLGLATPLTLVPQVGGDVASRQFVTLTQQVKQQQTHCAIVEPEARLALMKKLCREASGCRLVTLDPLGRAQAGQTYSRWWPQLVEAFYQCLRE